MKKAIYFSMFIAVLAMVVSSCKQDGCTDPDAANYCADCKNDNTCEYTGRLVFWYDAATADSLIDFESLSLTYYVDGEIVGSSSANVYWTAAPDCGQNGSITVEKTLGSAKNKSYSYRVKDQDDIVIWEGYENFTANTCLALQLTWDNYKKKK